MFREAPDIGGSPFYGCFFRGWGTYACWCCLRLPFEALTRGWGSRLLLDCFPTEVRLLLAEFYRWLLPELTICPAAFWKVALRRMLPVER